MRKLAVAVAVAVTTFFAQGIQAQAAVTDAFDGAITCTTQPAILSAARQRVRRTAVVWLEHFAARAWQHR